MLNDRSVHNIYIDGYQYPVRHDSNSKFGGVAIYINESLSFRNRHDLQFTSELCENIWVEIYDNHKPIIIGCIYRHISLSLYRWRSSTKF